MNSRSNGGDIGNKEELEESGGRRYNITPNSHRCTYIESAEKTLVYMLTECPELVPLRKTVKKLGFGGTIEELLKNATFLVRAAKIMLQSGRLEQFQHVNPYLYAF